MIVTTPRGSRVCRKPQAVILAGGKSSRFGKDKAAAPWRDATMLEALAISLKKAGFYMTISTSHEQHRAFGLPILWDEKPFQGPLFALVGVLEKLRAAHVLFTACDTPFLSSLVIRLLWEEKNGFDAVLLEGEDGKPSPLPGVYSSRILPVARAHLFKKETSLQNLLKSDVRVCVISRRDWVHVDPSERSLININFPHSFPSREQTTQDRSEAPK